MDGLELAAKLQIVDTTYEYVLTREDILPFSTKASLLTSRGQLLKEACLLNAIGGKPSCFGGQPIHTTLTVEASLHTVEASLHTVEASLHTVEAGLHTVKASLLIVEARLI
jgi:hypothetical protein